MKPTLRSLRIHQQVWALVEEVIAENEVIINFGGDLIRVSNQSNRILKAGQRVLTEVQEISPLNLKIVEQRNRNIFPNHLDVQV